MKSIMRAFLVLVCFLSAILHCSAGEAIDFRPRGNWVMSFGYGENGTFQGSYKNHQAPGWEAGQENLSIQERVQLQLETVVSPDLSACIGFEIGSMVLGNYSEGAALGADQTVVQLSSAYMDWNFPHFPLKARMGIQSIVTPAMASGNSILNGTMAGMAISAAFTKSITLTGVWGRLYNDNYPGYDNGIQASYLDNLDAGALFLPFEFEWAHFTPWILYAAVGPNVFRSAVSDGGYPYGNPSLGSNVSYCFSGLFPVGGAKHRNFSSANGARQLSSYGNGWWGGFSGAFTSLDPFQIRVDAEYGHMSWNDDWRLLRQGWFASLLLEYRLEWGVPGVYFWASSGDDANPANGSERMPSISADNSSNYSRFAFDGAPYLERNALIANNLAGTWGLGVRLATLKLLENWKQTLRINYISGTNSPQMGKKMSLAGLWANGFEMEPNYSGSGSLLGMPGVYLTTADRAVEFGMSSWLELNDNFGINVEAAYIALFLDTGKNVWGARHCHDQPIPETKDAWNANISFVFSF